MNPNQLRRLFPNASPDCLAENTRQDAELERDTSNAPLEAVEGQKGAAGRLLIRFVSVRKRLLDPDNLSEKWLLDCLRNCGAIEGDEPEEISLETGQRKVEKGEAEFTLIEIFEL